MGYLESRKKTSKIERPTNRLEVENGQVSSLLPPSCWSKGGIKGGVNPSLGSEGVGGMWESRKKATSRPPVARRAGGINKKRPLSDTSIFSRCESNKDEAAEVLADCVSDALGQHEDQQAGKFQSPLPK